MDKLEKILNFVTTLDNAKLLDENYNDPTITNFIEKSNTQDQLFQGVDATGVDLKSIGGDYTPFTKAYKKRKGQPTNRVTLKDSGNFYRSIQAKSIGNGDVEITGNTIKQGVDLQSRWGVNLIGLTKIKTNELGIKIKDNIIKKVRKGIGL